MQRPVPRPRVSRAAPCGPARCDDPLICPRTRAFGQAAIGRAPSTSRSIWARDGTRTSSSAGCRFFVGCGRGRTNARLGDARAPDRARGGGVSARLGRGYRRPVSRRPSLSFGREPGGDQRHAFAPVRRDAQLEMLQRRRSSRAGEAVACTRLEHDLNRPIFYVDEDSVRMRRIVQREETLLDSSSRSRRRMTDSAAASRCSPRRRRGRRAARPSADDQAASGSVLAANLPVSDAAAAGAVAAIRSRPARASAPRVGVVYRLETSCRSPARPCITGGHRRRGRMFGPSPQGSPVGLSLGSTTGVATVSRGNQNDRLVMRPSGSRARRLRLIAPSFLTGAFQLRSLRKRLRRPCRSRGVRAASDG